MQPTYCGIELDVLRAYLPATEEDKEHLYSRRRNIYDSIREKSGQGFADFGDDIERWIQWLEADDTRSYDETNVRYVAEFKKLSLEEQEKELEQRYQI